MTEDEKHEDEDKKSLKDGSVDKTDLPPDAEIPETEDPNETDNPATAEFTLKGSQKFTENMETHSHTRTPREKWTHYFWEFFMLFLAVTAGFFAENWREHYVEHLRARQYASFLYGDLIRDTVNLKERTAFMETGSKKLDTLIELLQSFKDNDTATAKIYALSAYVYSGAFFSATTSTIEQLKNSGSLRYFRSENLISDFSEYNTDLERLKSVEDRNAYLNEEIRIFLTQFLDLKSISRFTVNTGVDSSGFTLSQPLISRPLRLYKKEQHQLEQYANLCALKQFDWSTRIGLQTRVLASARNLIVSLKKEYHLE